MQIKVRMRFSQSMAYTNLGSGIGKATAMRLSDEGKSAVGRADERKAKEAAAE
jgi:NAD(P)-dependent dehydrogenase (short-subunit alcohol dehydrogenase family)